LLRRSETDTQRWDGAGLVALLAAAEVHHLEGANTVEQTAAREPWHHLADLVAEAATGAPPSGAEGRAAMASRLAAAMDALRAAGARVVASDGGPIVHVAVLMRGRRQDPR